MSRYGWVILLHRPATQNCFRDLQFLAWQSTRLFYGFSEKHLEYCERRMREYVSQHSSFPLEIKTLSRSQQTTGHYTIRMRLSSHKMMELYAEFRAGLGFIPRRICSTPRHKCPTRQTLTSVIAKMYSVQELHFVD
jgi:hypothetical protein